MDITEAEWCRRQTYYVWEEENKKARAGVLRRERTRAKASRRQEADSGAIQLPAESTATAAAAAAATEVLVTSLQHSLPAAPEALALSTAAKAETATGHAGGCQAWMLCPLSQVSHGRENCLGF